MTTERLDEPAAPGGAARRARRAWIAAHHPDRGGDPAVFVAGMRARAWLGHPAAEPVVFYRRRGVRAALTRLIGRRRWRRRRRRRGW